jgi:hypothetical protein
MHSTCRFFPTRPVTTRMDARGGLSLILLGWVGTCPESRRERPRGFDLGNISRCDLHIQLWYRGEMYGFQRL